MKEPTQIAKRDRRTKLRRVGLTVGVLGGGLATSVIWVFVPEVEVLGSFILVIPILAFGGILTLAWKKPFIGGILLIVFSFPTVPPFGLPLLAAGILFLLSWREAKRHSEAADG